MANQIYRNWLFNPLVLMVLVILWGPKLNAQSSKSPSTPPPIPNETNFMSCIQGPITPDSVTKWRSAAITKLFAPDSDDSASLNVAPAPNSSPGPSPVSSPDPSLNTPEPEYADRKETLSKAISDCFGEKIPQCLVPLQQYVSGHDHGDAMFDSTFLNTPQRQPPKELFTADAINTAYVIPVDIEDRAKKLGWPVVRYKSRHAGGFDHSTPSLVMIYVPGAKLSPPVGYDRWLNFALPADPDKFALNVLPTEPMPSLTDYINGQSASGKALPGTFTMVSVDRANGQTPAKIYFQKFSQTADIRLFDSSIHGAYIPSKNIDPDGCVGCHSSGLRAISPFGYHVREGESQMPADAWQTVKTINQAMEDAMGGMMVDWRSVSDGKTSKPLLKIDGYWPIFGALEPMNTYTRTKAFILGGTLPDGSISNGCYQSRPTVKVVDIFGRPPGLHNIYSINYSQPSTLGSEDDTVPKPVPQDINWQKVANAMKCEVCHDGVHRGSLPASPDVTDFSMIDFKILVDQSMPLGAHLNPLDQGSTTAKVQDSLTPNERIALANCLLDEVNEERKFKQKWLASTLCE